MISCHICEEEKENRYGYKTHITVDAKEDFIQGGYAIYVNVAVTKQF
jgi:D-arabinose 1-dehydrogenase-like Zn-dependent alcohol dehydrogenase